MAVFVTVGAVLAQASYTQLAPSLSPSPRSGIQGVSDGTNMWVFGGSLSVSSPPLFSDEIWRFDGVHWAHVTTPVRPQPRDWYAAAFDSVRGRYVLFGGRVFSAGTTADIGDTWEFDGSTWIQQSPTIAPSARRWSSMVYDPTLGRCVLFGGSHLGTTFLGDTWLWDGAAWNQQSSSQGPSPRARGRFTYDHLRSRALYYGGKSTSANVALTDTWSWIGATWSQITTSVQPGWNGGSGLIAYGLTYDSLRDRAVLVGGTRTAATVSDRTYEFDGGDWMLRGAGPLAGRTAPAVAFAWATGKTYVFGGFDGSAMRSDTWEYQTQDLANWLTFGSGCAGSAGVPEMTQVAAAWLGETHRMRVSGLDALGMAFAFVGLSDTVWSGGSLPSPLLAVYPTSASSCLLYVSPDAVTLLASGGGTATLSFGVPNDPGLLSVQLFQQVVQLDSALFLSASAAAAIGVGAK